MKKVSWLFVFVIALVLIVSCGRTRPESSRHRADDTTGTTVQSSRIHAEPDEPDRGNSSRLREGDDSDDSGRNGTSDSSRHHSGGSSSGDHTYDSF